MSTQCVMTDAQIVAVDAVKLTLTTAANGFTQQIAEACYSMKELITRQGQILKAVGLEPGVIASIVKQCVGDACSPLHISASLKAAGVSQRRQRSDAGIAKVLAKGAKNAVETALLPPEVKADEDEDEAEGEGEGEGEGGGITAEQIVALFENADGAVQDEAYAAICALRSV